VRETDAGRRAPARVFERWDVLFLMKCASSTTIAAEAELARASPLGAGGQGAPYVVTDDAMSAKPSMLVSAVVFAVVTVGRSVGVHRPTSRAPSFGSRLNDVRTTNRAAGTRFRRPAAASKSLRGSWPSPRPGRRAGTSPRCRAGRQRITCPPDGASAFPAGRGRRQGRPRRGPRPSHGRGGRRRRALPPKGAEERGPKQLPGPPGGGAPVPRSGAGGGRRRVRGRGKGDSASWRRDGPTSREGTTRRSAASGGGAPSRARTLLDFTRRPAFRWAKGAVQTRLARPSDTTTGPSASSGDQPTWSPGPRGSCARINRESSRSEALSISNKKFRD